MSALTLFYRVALACWIPLLWLKTHRVENRRRFSESKIGIDFRNACHAKTTSIRTCYISRSIFGSTWSIKTVVIVWSFIVSVWLVCKRCRIGQNTFCYFCSFRFDLQLQEWIIAEATASSSSFSAMSVFGVENRRRFSTPCVFNLRPPFSWKSCKIYYRQSFLFFQVYD